MCNRTLSGTAYTQAFDYDGELTSITQGSTVTSFTYDALGRRLSRTAGGTTTSFLYDGGSILLEKQASTTTATYTYGNGLIRKDGETPLFDGLGSERTVTNSSQTVTGTATYEGFGQTVATTGSSTDPYMFAATSGYRNDGDAGLMHVGARYYDAQVGRFITRVPIWIKSFTSTVSTIPNTPAFVKHYDRTFRILLANSSRTSSGRLIFCSMRRATCRGALPGTLV